MVQMALQQMEEKTVLIGKIWQIKNRGRKVLPRFFSTGWIPEEVLLWKERSVQMLQ